MDGFGFLPDTRDFAQRTRAVKRFLGAVRNGVQREPGAAQRTALVRTASSKGMGPRLRGMVARTGGGCGSGSNWMSGPAKQKSVGCGGGVAPSRAPADGFGFLDDGRAAVGKVRGQISSMRSRAMSTTKKSGCGCGGGCGGKTNGLGFLDSGSSQVPADVWANMEAAGKCGCGGQRTPGRSCECGGCENGNMRLAANAKGGVDGPSFGPSSSIGCCLGEEDDVSTCNRAPTFTSLGETIARSRNDEAIPNCDSSAAVGSFPLGFSGARWAFVPIAATLLPDGGGGLSIQSGADVSWCRIICELAFTGCLFTPPPDPWKMLYCPALYQLCLQKCIAEEEANRKTFICSWMAGLLREAECGRRMDGTPKAVCHYEWPNGSTVKEDGELIPYSRGSSICYRAKCPQTSRAVQIWHVNKFDPVPRTAKPGCPPGADLP